VKSTPFNKNFIENMSKDENPFGFEHHIHVFLCNYVYKVISNIIGVFLNPILSSHIYPREISFLDFHNILDAIDITQ
jgi:hypothetical protein